MGDDMDKPRTGRPKLAKDEARGAVISTRLTAAELAHVQEQADRAGLPLSDYCRRVLLRRKIAPAITDTDEAALADLNRIGVNLNQLTKRANASGKIPAGIEAVLAAVLASIERIGGRDR